MNFLLQSEVASLKRSLMDANVLLSDGRNTITSLKEENLALKAEMTKCEDSLVQLRKQSELKLFRLEQELVRRHHYQFSEYLVLVSLAQLKGKSLFVIC